MSSLCSAHFGKNIFRLSTRKVPKKQTSCVYEEIGKITKDLPPKLPPKKTSPLLPTKPRGVTPQPKGIPPLPTKGVSHPKSVTQTADEVYGFLPGQEFGSTPSLARSCRSLTSSRDSLDKSFPRNTGCSGHSSGYGSESSCSPPSGQDSPPSIRSYSSSSSGCSSSGSSTSTSSRYPKNSHEVAAQLEAANLKNPANIPLFVSRDHSAPVDWSGRNELSVRYGMIINALFKSFEWVYVRTGDDREGFIPMNCVRSIGKSENTSYAPKYSDNKSLNDSYETCSLSSSASSTTSSEESMVLSMKGLKRYDPELSILEGMKARRRSPVYLHRYPELDSLSMTSSTYNEDDDDVASVCSMMSSVSVASTVFSRYECADLTVLFDYTAMDQDDISVRKHETVALLNDEDPDWIWVKTVEGREGFIPRTYAADLRALNLDPSAKTTYF